jgi:hypothetical protein
MALAATAATSTTLIVLPPDAIGTDRLIKSSILRRMFPRSFRPKTWPSRRRRCGWRDRSLKLTLRPRPSRSRAAAWPQTDPSDSWFSAL